MTIGLTPKVQRALRVIKKLGEDALKPTFKPMWNGKMKWYPAPLRGHERADVRNYYLRNGKEWPYEHVYPGIKKEKLPPKLPKGSKKKRRRLAERKKLIEENMAKMPQWIKEYRESLKLKDVSLIDRLTLTVRQIRTKLKRGKTEFEY